MRWTRQRRARNGNRRAGSFEPVSDQAARRRTMLTRTAKSCGPDAPTLASSFAEACSARPGLEHAIIRVSDGGKRARSPGRSRSKPLKPLRRECRVNPVTCGDYTRVLPTLHTRPRVHRAPGIPCALFIPGRKFPAQLGRIAPREGGVVSAILSWPILRDAASRLLMRSLRPSW
jgi:hypothetical protein